jgi:metal-responsive CopG/Arc/MetJ family transcriptional regulator
MALGRRLHRCSLVTLQQRTRVSKHERLMSVESYTDLAVAESSYHMSHNACINVSIVSYCPKPADQPS